MNVTPQTQAQAAPAPVIIIGSGNVVSGNDSALLLHFLAVIEAQTRQIGQLINALQANQ